MVCLKNKEFPRFGATCILAEIIMMAYLFAVLILSFLLTRDFFLPNTSGRARIIIGIIGSFLPWIVIYPHYNKKRINGNKLRKKLHEIAAACLKILFLKMPSP